MGTILDPGKVNFGHFIFFGHFPIEIPMHLQICIFRPQGVLKSKKFQKKPTLKLNFTLKNMWASSSNFMGWRNGGMEAWDGIERMDDWS